MKAVTGPSQICWMRDLWLKWPGTSAHSMVTPSRPYFEAARINIPSAPVLFSSSELTVSLIWFVNSLLYSAVLPAPEAPIKAKPWNSC